MMKARLVPRFRWIAALAFLGFAFWEQRWLFLMPAAILLYQYYRDLNCAVCEAGFCEEENADKDHSAR